MERNNANFVPLTPVSFLRRAATVYPDKTAVIHGQRTYSYREFHERCCRLASALSRRGIRRGDTVAIMAPNIPAMLEAHYGVLMLGAVLNPLNIRLDSKAIAFILQHGEAKALISDREFSPLITKALTGVKTPPLVIEINDEMADYAPDSKRLSGEIEYEDLLAEGEVYFNEGQPADEWQTACLLYTSGTTGNPKGVLSHHRGAYLNSLSNMAAMGFNRHSVYLWTLPMFHCNGWCHTWAVTAACATHVCLRKVDPAMIYPQIKQHRVSHMCGAPVVLNMLVHAPDKIKLTFEHEVKFATGGASPPSAVIEAMEHNGFKISHLYGLTESFGPSLSCAWQDEWDGLELEARSAKMARQGVQSLTLEEAMVANSETLEAVPRDGRTMGELMLRGNTLMKGYFKNPEASSEAFRDGWFHTGDLAVRHPDGYIELRDRSKDVIISGGENISSLEIEEVLFRHPGVLKAAVVAKPDAKWGETPCAFVTLRDGCKASGKEIIAFCRKNLAGFKTPKTVAFGPLPKTATGKIQKFVLREHARRLSGLTVLKQNSRNRIK